MARSSPAWRRAGRSETAVGASSCTCAKASSTTRESAELSGVRGHGWFPGADVVHDDHGRGWVWGAGLGRVTVRFETRASGPGPILTLAADDPALHAVGIEPLARALDHGDEQDEALADED